MRRFALLPLLVVLLGCSSPFSPLDHVGGCSATTIGPLAGTAPTISWSGGCPVAGIGVVPLGSNGEVNGAAVWGVKGEPDAGGLTNNLIRSGVKYGTKPKLTITTVPATPLVRGQRYRVQLIVTDPLSRFLPGIAAQSDFTP